MTVGDRNGRVVLDAKKLTGGRLSLMVAGDRNQQLDFAATRGKGVSFSAASTAGDRNANDLTAFRVIERVAAAGHVAEDCNSDTFSRYLKPQAAGGRRRGGRGSQLHSRPQWRWRPHLAAVTLAAEDRNYWLPNVPADPPGNSSLLPAVAGDATVPE
jgi:hypothetical protein